MAALVLFLLVALPVVVRAHLAAFATGMYCQNVFQVPLDAAEHCADSDFQGLQHDYIYGTAEPALPLWNMPRSQWWMHGQCINYPPPAGEFLDL